MFVKIYKRQRLIGITAISLVLNAPIAHAQLSGDPMQAALDQAHGISNPIVEARKYAQENSAMREEAEEAANGGYHKKIADQIEENMFNSPEYQKLKQDEAKVKESLKFSEQELPDTGIFSRIHNKEIQTEKNKKAIEKDLDTPQASASIQKRSSSQSATNSTTFAGYAKALDALTLLVGGHKIILTGLKAPGNGEYCTLRGNYRWPCGDEARNATQQVINDIPLSCRLDLGNLGRCVDYRTGESIQKKIALTGYALPVGVEGASYSLESDEAREHHRGLFQD